MPNRVIVAVPVAVLLGVLVGIMVDAEPPVISLVSAPQWVRPGQAFQLDVAVSADINATTVWLEIPNVSVSEPVLNVTTSVIEFECTCSRSASDGARYVLARASDLAGNSLESVVGSIMVDGTAPTIMVKAGEPSIDNGTYTIVSRETCVLVTLMDAGSGPGAVFSGPSPGQMDMPFDLTNPCPFRDLPDGMHDLYFGGSDLAGNQVEMPAVLPVLVDGTPPSLDYSLNPTDEIGTYQHPAVSPTTALKVISVDGINGSGVARIEYAVEGLYSGPLEWYPYYRPTHFLSIPLGAPEPLGVRLYLRSYDLIGNEASAAENLRFVWSGPYINISKFDIPEYTNNSKLRLDVDLRKDLAHDEQVRSVDVRVLSSTGTRDYYDYVAEDGLLDLEFDLGPGLNGIEFAFTDVVGVKREYEPVLVIYDAEAPRVVSTSPTPGSRDTNAGRLAILVTFSEPIDRETLVPTILVDGVRASPVVIRWGIDGNESLMLVPDEIVGPGTYVEVSLLFSDFARNRGSSNLTFWTAGGEPEAVSASDFLWGLFIGLVLGMVVAYLVVLRLRRGSLPRRPSGPQPLFDMGLRPAPSILAPDEERLDDRAMGTTPSGPTAMASAPSTRDDIAKGPPPSRDGEVPGQAPPGPEEGVGQEGGREEEGGHGGDAGHDHDDEVDEELSADLDRLIEQATRPSSPAVTHEFTDGESVDVDAREGSDGEHLPDP